MEIVEKLPLLKLAAQADTLPASVELLVIPEGGKFKVLCRRQTVGCTFCMYLMIHAFGAARVPKANSRLFRARDGEAGDTFNVKLPRPNTQLDRMDDELELQQKLFHEYIALQ